MTARAGDCGEVEQEQKLEEGQNILMTDAHGCDV